ncbi:MAG: hypothetical protein Q9184_004021 [Pyrenodesmia sp. 2 TL-2023]
MRDVRIYLVLFASFAWLSSVIADPNVDDYIIYPVETLGVDESSKLDELIRELAVNPENVYVSKRLNVDIPTYWGATLSASGFSKMKGHPWIEDIFPNEPLVEQFAEYRVQHSPPEELRVISQPPGPEPIDRYHDYVYRSDLQKPVFIYHAELGINANHIDFAGRQVEWLYTDRAKATGHESETESPSTRAPGHSTCTASKAAGKIYGSSRLATLVVVKMPDLTPLSTGEVFSTITDHILENGRRGQSIISVSWGSKAPVSIEDHNRGVHWSHWRRVGRQVGELDALSIILFAAGNAALEMDSLGRDRRDVDTAPAIYAARLAITKALAVSNVDNRGRLWRTSQSVLKPDVSWKNLFAPGVQIKCAAHDSDLNVRIRTGTSFAAPLAAGVIADAMATNQIRETDGVPDIATIITYAQGWKRDVGGKSVIWNHVDKANNPPSNILVQSLSNETLDATVAVA